ncbi:MAG TPA: exonuclease SbcCD subunit D [Methanomassiliicoccales archaeon]|nr:exonuclease SbcCD subunit D [Methanomassiliicoccales archaeon]
MRIAHIADTHVGFSAYRRSDPETGMNQREVDVYQAFERLVDSLISKRPDVVLHSGDLFDSVRPSNRALSVVLEQLLRLSDASIPVVLIAGNHSTPRLKETGSVFRLFEHIKGVTPFYTPGMHRLDLGDLTVTAFPHQDKESMVNALQSWKRGHSRYEVGMLHAGIQGLTRYSMGEANELNLPSSLLNLEADYIALGHFHDREQITENAWYSGSLERLSFAEAGQEKGYNLVDLERDRKEFVRLPTRPMYSLGPFKAKGKEANVLQDELMAALGSVKVEGSIVRLVVKDVPAALYRSLDLNALRAMAEKAVHLDLNLEIVQGTDAVQWRSTTFGSLGQEFEAYLSQVPVEGVDKDELRRRGLDYLGKEAGE